MLMLAGRSKRKFWIMSRRMLGLIGLVVTVILAPLAWVFLAGGKGAMHNVWRNTALGALIPWAIYSLVLLLRSTPGKSPSTKSETQGDGPVQSAGAVGASPLRSILLIIGVLVLLNFILKPLLVKLLTRDH